MHLLFLILINIVTKFSAPTIFFSRQVILWESQSELCAKNVTNSTKKFYIAAVHLHKIKAQKLDQLIGPQNNSDSSPESLKTAIRIPENLPLSDSEKSVLSKS